MRGHIKTFCSACGRQMVVIGQNCKKCGHKQEPPTMEEGNWKTFLRSIGLRFKGDK